MSVLGNLEGLTSYRSRFVCLLSLACSGYCFIVATTTETGVWFTIGSIHLNHCCILLCRLVHESVGEGDNRHIIIERCEESKTCVFLFSASDFFCEV